jgi:hypothetical protein
MEFAMSKQQDEALMFMIHVKVPFEWWANPCELYASAQWQSWNAFYRGWHSSGAYRNTWQQTLYAANFLGASRD